MWAKWRWCTDLRTGLAGGKHLVLNKSDVSANPAKIGDGFGHALAAADFNKDGYTDIAIGVPQDDLAKTDAGAVYIVYGSRDGLVKKKSAPIIQTMVSNDPCEAGDFFGFSLATGDFNKDGYPDLVIGAPYEDVVINGQSRPDAGAVSIAYGSGTGLAMKKTALIVQSNVSEDASENGDVFGFSLAVGDFNRDGAADLAIGVPGENLPLGQGKTANDAGSPWHSDTYLMIGASKCLGLFSDCLAVLRDPESHGRQVALLQGTASACGRGIGAISW